MDNSVRDQVFLLLHQLANLSHCRVHCLLQTSLCCQKGQMNHGTVCSKIAFRVPIPTGSFRREEPAEQSSVKPTRLVQCPLLHSGSAFLCWMNALGDRVWDHDHEFTRRSCFLPDRHCSVSFLRMIASEMSSKRSRRLLCSSDMKVRLLFALDVFSGSLHTVCSPFLPSKDLTVRSR